MTEIQPPFEAYLGDVPYLFVSYAHADKDSVYPLIDILHNKKVRIWYDEGIPASSNWIEQIADKIIKCSCFLVFITPNVLESDHVRDEISLAKMEKKKMFVIYLKDTKLTPEIKLQFIRIQALFKYRMTEAVFWRKLMNELSEVTSSSSNIAQDLTGIFGPARVKGKTLEKLENSKKKKEQKVERNEPPINEIIELLRDYENIKNEELMEIESTQRLGELYPILQLLGFSLDQNSLRDNNFGVHVTNFPVIHQFLIRRLEVGKNKNPDELYLSQKYPQTTKDSLNTNIQVLNDFIEYIRKKLENI